MHDEKQFPRIQPFPAVLTAALFESLHAEVKCIGVPAGKLKLSRGGRVEGVSDWAGSPLIAGLDDHGRRYIAVETESHEYLYREDVPERIIDFTSWFVLWEPELPQFDEHVICGSYGDRELTRIGPAEILHMRQVLLGWSVYYRTETDNFIEVRASRRYLECCGARYDRR